ncbi:MAG: N-acetylmuramoyl-L-alanine amidase [Chloroherpetonaceae bacterium]
MGGKQNFFIAIFVIFLCVYKSSYSAEYLQIKPHKGDGIYSLLKKYELPNDSSYFNKFVELNKNRLSGKNEIFSHYEYKMPILIFEYNGINIRSSIGIDNYDIALEIQNWNNKLLKNKIKLQDYKISKEIWVPFHYIKSQSKSNEQVDENESSDKVPAEITTKKFSKKLNNERIFGKKYTQIQKIDNSLNGYVFYIDPGHGGPDPGAIGYKNGQELHEDEYAYDVSLRLARNLMQHGAEVFLTIIDPNDGIRDDKYLRNSKDEMFGNRTIIIGNSRERLQSRIDYINEIYSTRKKSQHRLIIIHVDSRQFDQKIDIFFYNQPGDTASKKYANILLKTIENKYLVNQPQRGYRGTLADRNLFMLRHSPCSAVYIELGNIQNSTDQIRLIEPNNRQAIANWLTQGILKADTRTSTILKSKKKSHKK